MPVVPAVLPPPQLPGRHVRPATPGDVDSVFRLMADSALAMTGDQDTSRDEVASELANPAIDLATDTLLVEEPDGRATGYVVACDDDPGRAYVDVYLDPALTDGDFFTVGRALMAWGLDRVAQFVAASGRSKVRVVSGTYVEERRQRHVLSDAGFVDDRVYWRMSVDLDPRPPRPAVPPGVRLRRIDLTRDEERLLAHRLAEEVMAEHHGHVARDPEAFWAQHNDAVAIFDPTAWWVGEVDGEPAGILIGDESRIDDNGGYVRTLGVLPASRGRGVAKALLHEAFEEYAGRGRATVSLGVDSENATGATALYESVGMHQSASIVFGIRDVLV